MHSSKYLSTKEAIKGVAVSNATVIFETLTLSHPLDVNYFLEQGQGHGHLSKYLISGLIFHFFHLYMKKKLQTLL